MFVSEFNIICKMKVYESGYEIVDKRIRPIHKNSNYREENFSKKTYSEFMDLINHLSNQDIFEERLIVFCKKYGLPFSDQTYIANDQSITGIKALLGQFSQIREKIQKGALPKTGFNALPPSAKLSYKFNNGKVLPTFEVKELIDALEISFWLTGDFEQVTYKKCKYFEEYGLRLGCIKSFPHKNSRKKFCSRGCKDRFNEKKAKLKQNERR